MYNEISNINRLVRALVKDRIQTNGRDVFQFQGNASFTLSEDYPSSSTIRVYKNGTPLLTGWSYNSSTNILTISAILATHDIILITYSFYDKYSDNEINDYIECALTYFSQYGYKKTFRFDDARTAIISTDGLNPTMKECYEFAIISSIITDPQNIEIRTKDFTVTATEKESKSDLIGKAMMQFTTWYGEFVFDEDLRRDVY